jgi:uncharacterized protein (TIGR02246 family)
MQDDEQAIRNLVATWLDASKSGDSEKVLSLMAEDVVFLLPGQPPMRGRSGFASAQAGFKGRLVNAASDIQEIAVFGEWAYCWSRLSVEFSPGDGDARIHKSGDVLSVLRKQAGEWAIYRDANMLS